MKQRLFYILWLYLFFLVFSFFSRITFFIFNIQLTADASFNEILLSFWHGLRLDLSASAYLMIVPMLLLIISSVIKINVFKNILPYYTWTILILLSLVLVSDMELYKFWGFRLDATPIVYIKTPKEALASISFWVIIRQLIIAAVIVFVFSWIFKKYIRNMPQEAFKLVEIPVYVFLFAFLIVPIRGGFGIAPINVGSAYFSQNSFINHAAINVYWNLGNSLADQNSKTHKYRYYDEQEAKDLVNPYLNQQDTSTAKHLNLEKPNIILIMMESFTSNMIKPLGGLPNVTPAFNSLAEEGILFTNMYSSGDRSDKGLVSILSGYPAQATFSVIKDAGKTQLLPKLPLDLKNAGYQTSFYYGGDLNFANMRSYLVSAGFANLISKDEFPANTYNSKWGAHDEVVFEKLFQDINAEKYPFFKMLFTLSSHEPFEVPVTRIKGNDEESKFLNSASYADSCLGDFIRKAKKQAWWENTWVIIVADHGMRLPGNLKVHESGKFYIPMLWLGGAIDKHLKVEKTVSQTDIAVTVLNQLGLSGNEYQFSRNIFGKNQKTDAFYIFNNGIGMVNDSMKLIFDCTNNAVIHSEGNITDSLVDVTKAYIQNIYSDLNSR